MQIVLLKEGKLTCLADGSPMYIATLIQNHRVPVGAIISGLKTNYIMPENLSEVERSALINKIKTEQLDYVICHMKDHRKGTYHHLVYKKDLSEKCTRITKTIVRFGCEYSHMNGSPTNGGGLPYGDWEEGYSTFLINNKGNIQLRCALSKGKYHKKEDLYLDSDLNEIESSEVPKEKRGHPTQVFNVKIENIIKM